MLLALGLLACFALWWLSKTGDGFGRRLGRAVGLGVGAAAGRFPAPRKVAGSLALAAAGFLLLRGNLVMAALLGLGGVWMLKGADGIGRRARQILAFGRGARPEPGRRYRTGLIEVLIRPDGSLSEGRVIAGPGTGTRLDDMPQAAVAALMRSCDRADPEGAALLEAYLDRRAPGWRVDAEGNRDPRAGGAPNPGAMTQEEAHQILGLERGASPEQIRTAHRTLMKRAHPDQGGSAERAARVNAARDRLLSRHR